MFFRILQDRIRLDAARQVPPLLLNVSRAPASFNSPATFLAQAAVSSMPSLNSSLSQPASTWRTRLATPSVPITCWNCFQRGHYLAECPNPPVLGCRRCRTAAHGADSCPRQSPAIAPSAAATTAPVGLAAPGVSRPAAAAAALFTATIARDGTGLQSNNIASSDYSPVLECDAVSTTVPNFTIFSESPPANLTSVTLPAEISEQFDRQSSHVAPCLVLAAHSSASRSLLTRRRWIVDSGASIHIVSSLDTLDKIDSTIPSVLVTTADGTVVKSEAAGPCSVTVINPLTRVAFIIHLKCAYYVPGAAFNLLSVQNVQQTGLAVHFDAQVAGFSGTLRLSSQLDKILCCIQLVGGALTLTCPGLPSLVDMSSLNTMSACASVTMSHNSSADDVSSFLRARNDKGKDVTTWTLAEAHSYLGHRTPADILKMVDRGLLPRVRLSSRSMPPCSACLTGTINAHAAVSTHHHRATRPLERLYLDFFIPAQENIIPNRAAAVLYIVDEATRFLWTHVAESRTAAMSWFRAQVAHWERRCRQRVVEIVTDCAPEFLATNFRDWASNLGIDQLYSVAHEPIHNGAVERAIQTLTRSTRQLLLDGVLPARFWPEALSHAVWLYNRFPHASLDGLFSPFTAMFQQPARLHHLRGFGSLAFVKLWPRPAKLTASQAFLGVFIGFSTRADASLFWDPARDILVSSVSFRPLPNTTYRDYNKLVLRLPSMTSWEHSSFSEGMSHDSAALNEPLDCTPPSLPTPPAPFSCAVTDCGACALEQAFLEVRACQEPFDERYRTSDHCNICLKGGHLILCDFCEVVYHSTCLPAMQAHIPAAGFVCVDCYADSFPNRKDQYSSLLFGTAGSATELSVPGLVETGSSVAVGEGAGMVSGVSNATAGVDTRVTLGASVGADGVEHIGAGEDGNVTVKLDDTTAARACATERQGVRTRAQLRADFQAAPRSPLLRKIHLPSSVRPRSRAVLLRRGEKSARVRPIAMAAQISDNSADLLLEHAILRAQEERLSLPYVVQTRSGEAALPMVRGYTKELWVDRATRHPLWFANLIELRALHARVDELSLGVRQSPRSRRMLHFAGAAVLQTNSPSADSYPPGTPEDVRHKQAWEVPVPTNYSQATRGSHSQAWYASMSRELHSLIERQTWREGYIPPGIKAIATKWVYNVKSSLLFKSRLVARGDQRPRNSFEPESDSPTLSRVSLNTLFAVGQTLGWHMHALDVDCAYLYGDVPNSVRGKVWLQLPQGMQSSLPHVEGRTIGLDLQHTLYGLRFSGRQWFMKLHQFLVANGYSPSVVDPCIYLRRSATGFVAIAVYVDDLAVFSSSAQLLSDTKSCLMTRFKMKDLGEISRYLGLEVERTETSFTYHVAPYIAELAAQYLTDDHPPVLSPADPGVRLSARACPVPGSDEAIFMASVPYDSLVGSLSYIAVAVRPDIARAVHTLQRAQAHPTRAHWQAALRILQYLRSTPTLGPRYSTFAGSQSQLQVQAYVDASFAPDWHDDDGVSVSGFLVYFAGGPIAWASHKQKHVAGSTCESEFIALSECLNVIEWIRHFLGELGIIQQKTKVFEDNQAAISLATSLSVSGNSRHVVVRYARVREAVANETLDVIYVPTNLQYADTLTKVVSTPNFIKNLPFILGQSVSDIKRSRQAYIDSYAFSRDSSVVSI